MWRVKLEPGNTKGGSITVPLTSCLTGLESGVCLQTIFVFICKTDYSIPVKQGMGEGKTTSRLSAHFRDRNDFIWQANLT